MLKHDWFYLRGYQRAKVTLEDDAVKAHCVDSGSREVNGVDMLRTRAPAIAYKCMFCYFGLNRACHVFQCILSFLGFCGV